MKGLLWTAGALVALTATALCACGVDATDDTGQVASEVVGGSETFEWPGIGLLSVGCTGTLVAPNVVLTAAHCFEYRTELADGDRGTFEVRRGPGDSRSFRVTSFVSLGSGIGHRDVALARLSDPVPRDVAEPLVIHDAPLEPSEGVTQFGYGCTDRASFGGGGVKRKRESTFVRGLPRPQANCPGDSGGPVLLHRNARVALVTSGWGGAGATAFDVYGNTSDVYPELLALLARWAPERLAGCRCDGGVDELGRPIDGNVTFCGTFGRRGIAASAMPSIVLWNATLTRECSSEIVQAPRTRAQEHERAGPIARRVGRRRRPPRAPASHAPPTCGTRVASFPEPLSESRR